MTLLTLTLSLLLSGSADQLTELQVGALKLKVPGAWKRSVEQGTHRFDAPSEDASFSLDVFPLPSPLAPKICRDKLIEALGGKGWELMSLGAAPAARRVLLDTDAKTNTAVETYSYVGCNGKTKWALTFAASAGAKKRFEPLAQQVASSIEYVREKR